MTAGSGVGEMGYRFLVAPEVAGPLWTALLAMGSEPMGGAAWDRLRIAQGREVHVSYEEGRKEERKCGGAGSRRDIEEASR